MNAVTPNPGATPISSVEIEQMIIGGAMLENGAMPMLRAKLNARCFGEELHQRLWETCCALDDGGRSITPLTIAPYFPERIDGINLSASQYLARLAANGLGGVVLSNYADALIQAAGRRDIVAIASDIADWARDPAPSVTAAQIAEEMASRAQGVIDACSPRGTTLHAGDAADAVLDRAAKAMRGEVSVETFETGLVDLDSALGGGLAAGSLVTVAGRPAMGKSVMGVTLAYSVAERGAGAMFVSLELPSAEIAARFLSHGARARNGEPVPFQTIPNALGMTEGRFRSISDAGANMRQMPLVIDAASSASVAAIRAKVRMQKALMARRGARLSVVVIDYLKFIEASDRYKGQRVYEVAEITRGLKQLAKDEAVAVVLLAQLNRGVEGRDDKRPGLADLRESGDIESDSDVVGFIYREAYYIKKSPDYRAGKAEAEDAYETCKRAGELIIAKNRNGPETTVRLYAEIENSFFASAARDGWR